MKKLYTGMGDDGFSGRLGEGRLPKDDPLFEALGAIDEATACLGLARVICISPATKSMIKAIQKDLYHVMAEVSAVPENAASFRQVEAERVAWLEATIDRLQDKIDFPSEFILPGDSLGGAYMALARTVVRRAERQLTSLYRAGKIENIQLIRYLNRLSSLCFLLELEENSLSGIATPSLAKD